LPFADEELNQRTMREQDQEEVRND
jgi:hypothetical protein